MSKGAFTDKQHPPTPRQISVALGRCRPVWDSLVKHVRAAHQARGELKFYGRNFGWAIRFRRGAKNLLALYPDQGSFTAQVIMSEGDVELSRKLKLSKRVRDAIDAAHPFPEGRWIYFSIRSTREVADMEALIALKSPPGGTRRATGSKPKAATSSRQGRTRPRQGSA
jgi:hypothetical protein